MSLLSKLNNTVAKCALYTAVPLMAALASCSKEEIIIEDIKDGEELPVKNDKGEVCDTERFSDEAEDVLSQNTSLNVKIDEVSYDAYFNELTIYGVASDKNDNGACGDSQFRLVGELICADNEDKAGVVRVSNSGVEAYLDLAKTQNDIVSIRNGCSEDAFKENALGMAVLSEGDTARIVLFSGEFVKNALLTDLDSVQGNVFAIKSNGYLDLNVGVK